MVVNGEPYLIEYNVRMGDPECQTILPKLKTSLLEVIIACTKGELKNIELEWHNEKSLCIVLCSKGYPDKYENNIPLENIDKMNLENNDYCFHAGTKLENNKVFSNGGRVLNFVNLSNDFKDSRNKLINIIKKLNWANGFFREDIGYKVIDK